MTAFYNENDAYPAQWLRNLAAAGHIAPGTVDERSVNDLDPKELAGFTQAHFFAGIGGWSRALRLAGVPDHFPVWTGSCPCQPFSAAGKRGGADDQRHLWPAWFRLIRLRRPPTIFGEQVASKDGLKWFDAVRADLEAEGYAVAAADLCAASLGAPHIRQRLFFVADSSGGRWDGRAPDARRGQEQRAAAPRPSEARELAHAESHRAGHAEPERVGRSAAILEAHGAIGSVAYASSARAGRYPRAAPGPQAGVSGPRGADGELGGDVPVAGGAVGKLALSSSAERGSWRAGRQGETGARAHAEPSGSGADGLVDDPAGTRPLSAGEGPEGEARDQARLRGLERGRRAGLAGDVDDPRPQGRIERWNGADQLPARAAGLGGFWSNADWLPCRDGKARPVEPGPQQMADGFAESVGRLRPGISAALTEEIVDACDEGDARQALRDLWIANAEEAIQRPHGRCRSVHEAPILLALLRELAGARWSLIDHLPSACFESAEAGLRELRQAAPPAARSPHRREPGEQRPRELADALPVVSRALARAAEAWGIVPFPLIVGADSRIGRLRAYGNSIIPQVAAAFVTAFFDANP